MKAKNIRSIFQKWLSLDNNFSSRVIAIMLNICVPCKYEIAKDTIVLNAEMFPLTLVLPKI